MPRFFLAVALILAAPAALAQLPRPIGPPPVGAPPLTNDQLLSIVFSEIERKVIGDYYQRSRADQERQAARPATQGRGNRGQAAPPGLAKRDELPPGIQNRVAKHGTLPPGLAKKALPSDLDRLLPRPSFGTERVIVDRDILLVQLGTGLVLDILEGVLEGGR